MCWRVKTDGVLVLGRSLAASRRRAAIDGPRLARPANSREPSQALGRSCQRYKGKSYNHRPIAGRCGWLQGLIGQCRQSELPSLRQLGSSLSESGAHHRTHERFVASRLRRGNLPALLDALICMEYGVWSTSYITDNWSSDVSASVTFGGQFPSFLWRPLRSRPFWPPTAA